MDSFFGKLLNSDEPTLLEVAQSKAKYSGNDLAIEVITYTINFMWTAFVFFLYDSITLKIFAMVNLVGVLILKIAMRINFYNDLIKIKDTKKYQILGRIVTILFWLCIVSILLAFAIQSGVKSNQNLVKEFSEAIEPYIVTFSTCGCFILGLLNLFVWFFVDPNRIVQTKKEEK